MPVKPMGYWISPNGMVYYTDDHFQFVLEHQKLFKITKSDLKWIDMLARLESVNPETGESLIDRLLKNKWIRIRSDGKNHLFQVWIFTDNIAFDIKMFLMKLKTPPADKVLVEESSTGASFYEPAEFFYSDESLKYTRNPRKLRR